MGLLNSNTTKWYTSRMFWLGVLEVVGPLVVDYFKDVPPEILVTGLTAGLTTVLLRFNTKKGIE